MTEAEAQQILLVRSLEAERLSAWSDDQRREVSRAAAARTGLSDEAAFFVRRARLAIERVRPRIPAIDMLLRASTWPRALGLATIPVALLLGGLIDVVGNAQRINVLAPPMIAIMFWNFVVYILLGYRFIRSYALAAEASVPRAARPSPAVRAVAAAIGRVARRSIRGRLADDQLRPLSVRFLTDWTGSALALYAARVAALLHAAAAAFALGALVALYVRGLAFEYRAGWESTFLEVESVHALLQMLLGPASVLSGIALPSVERLGALRFPASDGENAANWIHLYALTVGLIVIVPRLALSVFAALRAARRSQNFPLALDSPYFRTLLRETRGDALDLLILPYGRSMDLPARERLEALLRRAAIGPVRVRVAPTTSIGAEDDAAEAIPTGFDGAAALALYGGASTPEFEHHAHFLQLLRGALPHACSLFAIVDESSFARRFGTLGNRIGERREAWRRVLADTPSGEPVFVSLEAAVQSGGTDEERWQAAASALAERLAGIDDRQPRASGESRDAAADEDAR